MKSTSLAVMYSVRVLSLCFAGSAVWLKAEPAVTVKVQAKASQEAYATLHDESMADILETYCTDCHFSKKQEGDVRLDNFGELPADLKAELMDRIEKQVFTGAMPPDKDDALHPKDREVFFKSVDGLHAAMGTTSKFKSKMEWPHYGNYVDHDKLFSGEYKDLPGFTYDRKWLISEYIFKEKMNTILRVNESTQSHVDGKSQMVRGHALPSDIANPFMLPAGSGVRYYANQKMGSGHLMTMIGNSKHAADAMVNHLSAKYKDFLPSVSQIAKAQEQHKAVLGSRMAYLDYHIDVLCQELYPEDNEAWLPTYTKIPFKNVAGRPSAFIGKHPDRLRNAYLNSGDGIAAATAILRHFKTTKNTNELIRLCEKHAFHEGLSRDQVEIMVETLQVNIDELLEHFQANSKHCNVLRNMNLKLAADDKEIVSATIRKIRKKGMSYRELRQACVDYWNQQFYEELDKSHPLKGEIANNIITELYIKIYEREPSQGERDKQIALLLSYSSKMGVLDAIEKLTQTLFLSSEFINRNEYGVGKADEHGRRMLSPRDASYAIAYALTDSSPDEKLVAAAKEGRLNTRADYKREVERLLAERSHATIIDTILQSSSGGDNFTQQPIRKLRFFREFFGYYEALSVFKDQPRFGHMMAGARERLIAEADLLVDHILEKDQDVFNELLTTDQFYVFHTGDNESVGALSERVSKAYHYFKKHDWRQIETIKDLEKHKEFLVSNGVPGMKSNGKGGGGPLTKIDKTVFDSFRKVMADYDKRFEGGKNKHIGPFAFIHKHGFGAHRRLGLRNGSRQVGFLTNQNVAGFYGIDPLRWNYPPQQPAKLEKRMGILTHPAWLQAKSQNAQNDPVKRGAWVREKLLAGTIPDIPIGVEAQIPQDHTKSLRDRLNSVTTAEQCWRCHIYMNPLGNPFEIYDDFGRFRTEEELEHPDNVVGEVTYYKPRGEAGKRLLYKTLPVNATGLLDSTGDSKLDGEVKDALDMIDRLAQSPRVRQSIIRHAFRYFMGRNEMLSDSKTLIDADQAYQQSGGSFDAVIVSLLTSDSFIYRKPIQD